LQRLQRVFQTGCFGSESPAKVVPYDFAERREERSLRITVEQRFVFGQVKMKLSCRAVKAIAGATEKTAFRSRPFFYASS
jgi:hypothetical protein